MIDTRNVRDDLKGKTNEEIKEIISPHRLPFALLLVNLKHELNFGNIIRTNNALGGKEIFVYGRKKWDRRAAVGTHHYENIHYIKEIGKIQELKSRFTFVGLDNIQNAQPITSYQWPKNPLICIGHEGDGLEVVPEIVELLDDVVYIPQIGSVRSMNVGTAAGIAMYDFTIKYKM